MNQSTDESRTYELVELLGETNDYLRRILSWTQIFGFFFIVLPLVGLVLFLAGHSNS